jgi:glycolate oxidase FAD binding subunit
MDAALQAIIDQIRSAQASHTPLRPRGTGSKDFYGQNSAAQALELGAYRGIVSYEPSELVVTVRAGTPLDELEATLAERQQYLPFEPPHFFTHPGSCGGMVAAGLSGPARASVGNVRDYVLGVQMLNARGEHLTFGGQVMKNVAGYDMSRLMAGSLGTLGVLTDISLKVLPIAPAESTLVFQVDQAQALAQLNRWGGQPLPLNASCWVRDDTAADAPELLFVRLRGAVAAVASAQSRMLQDLPGQVMDPTQAQADWQLCRNLQLPFFTPAPSTDSSTEHAVLWRLSVPQTAPALQLAWPQLIEWHGAQRWLWAPWSAQQALREAAARVGGSASVFFDPAPAAHAHEARFAPLAPAVATIHQRIKTEMDPAGIFNPGRMYPSL